MMAESTGRRLHINRCTADRLSMVAGISLQTAKRIIAYRRRKQRFANIDEVSNVRGITPKDLESLHQTTTVSHRRKATPANSAISSEVPSGMKQVRRTVVKPATPEKSTKSKRGKAIKPRTLRKGTQTIETVDSGGKKMKVAIRGVRKAEKLRVRANRKVGPRRQTAVSSQQASGRTGKRQPKEKLQKNLFRSRPLHVSTPASSPGSLLMCREAHRLKATEGLDYIANTGSPRPLVLTSQREGTEQARAQINNCAVTVHMIGRAPLMSPMVTVNIPSSVLLTELEAPETGCGIERDVSPEICRPIQAQVPVLSTSTPSVDVAIASVPSTGDGQKEQVGLDQTDIGTSKDLNNSNNKETDLSEEKVISESPQTNFIDDVNNEIQEGYVAGSDTDHATDNGDSNAIFVSLPTKQATTAVDKEGTAAFVLQVREDVPAPKSDMMSTSASTGRGKRRTRSRRQTAEKVKRWLVDSSSSNIETQFERSFKDKRVAEDSFMSGITVLPSTTPAQQKSGSSKTIPNSRARCKRGLEQELDTAVEIQPATGNKSSQTPPCTCRSCRRKRRANRKSETADSSVKRPRTEAELSPDAHNQEFSTAWCLLL